ncbi:hypothetical protein BDQ12DRAFT_121772 [Crucibulum laeve]|uniref:Arrestin-like N-terminal domain-containing protein n=1 Tax=Crucibulum laeve TaxID=68775 RepID=A0A5C3LYW0_9AGAR|nr:hypothetical protein BDQ12DRAFT_121772 [Crucibulum laeve]
MRRRAESTSESRSARPASKFVPLSIYSHVSTYRSLQLELQLYSPSLKVQEDGHRGPLAVFSEHDQVGGKVILDQSCFHTGRLTVSIEGSFSYCPKEKEENGQECASSSEPRKHIFLSSSTVIPVSPNTEPSSPRSAFREAFIRRRPSASCINNAPSAADRSHPFTFHLPQSCRAGEELPPTFTTSKEMLGVKYKIIASWEPNDAFENNSHLEVPIVIQPDTDFQCADASTVSPDSWLEMPLKSDRPMPFRCAVTLPTSVTFTRSSSIPYFVVFTTIPRSASLAKEIAADATISVSLLRQINISEQIPLPPTPPHTPSSEESDTPRTKLLKRVRAQPRLVRPRRISETTSTELYEKPLPALPMQTVFSDTHSLQNNMCIGFPKRPRLQMCDTGNHPTLESHASLPDGLHKARIPLDKEMLPCIDWSGISVKYYLDISVLIGQDDLRARIPVRII